MIDAFKYRALSTKCISSERKKKLRKRVDDGRAIREAGSIPSDSHYTLPTNQDTHYHQIMDSSQGIDLEGVKHEVWKIIKINPSHHLINTLCKSAISVECYTLSKWGMGLWAVCSIYIF